MKKIILTLLSTGLVLLSMAQCPTDVKVQNIVTPTCGVANGAFTVLVSGASGNVNVSINNGLTYTGTTSGSLLFSNLLPGKYPIKIMTGTNVCDSFSFNLVAPYDASAVVNSTPTSGCQNTNGSIVLSNVPSTDSVSWLSGINPIFSQVGTGIIPNLKTGKYYLILKGTPFCYSTDTITVQNSGVACAVPSFCGNATDANNLFPNGTFGSGGNADGSVDQRNGPQLPTGVTGYTYQPLSPFGPEDGFYTVANNTNYSSGTPFANTWFDGYDHDYTLTGIKNGYQLVVNASYASDIVIDEPISVPCTDHTYQYSAYIRDLDITSGQIPANLEFLVDGIGVYSTGNINAGDGSWHQVGFTFTTVNSSPRMSIRNNATGGSGNDWAIDDIYVGSCVPTITYSPITFVNCIPQNPIATVTDNSATWLYFKWQVNKNDGNGFVDYTTASAESSTTSYQVTLNLPTNYNGSLGWKFQLVLATTQAELSSGCSYTSGTSFVLQLCSIALPIKNIDIKGQIVDNQANINFNLVDQTDISSFIVEKSLDGKDFTEFTTIYPNDNMNYSLNDNSLSSVQYYKVIAVEKDGTEYSSPIIILKYTNLAENIQLFPNPATNNIHIIIPEGQILDNLTIIDNLGQVLLRTSTLNNYTLDVSNFATGTYIAKIVTNKQETNIKFIKE
jgi:Secretion system C-terminal sorting domain